MPPTRILEIACFSAQSVHNAIQCEASRVELCRDQSVGGLTPELEMVKRLSSHVKMAQMPMRVMVRCRGGDFTCSEDEFDRMKQDVLSMKPFVQGFVFGILTPEHKVDEQRCQQLVGLASPLPCTFHRAFDQTQNLSQSLDALINCGFKSVLTSGAPNDAVGGTSALKTLIEVAGDRIEVMVGGGVRSHNLPQILSETHAKAFHTAATTGEGADASAAEIAALLQLLS